MVAATLFLLIAHFVSMSLPACDGCYIQIFPIVMFGIGYSVFASTLWPSIPYVVQAKTVGTAFGITTAIQNIGMSFAPTIAGIIHDQTISLDSGYYWVISFILLTHYYSNPFFLQCLLWLGQH